MVERVVGPHPAAALLEQGPLYNSINFGNALPFGGAPFNINNPINTTATYTRINGLNCPSDGDRLTDPNGHNNYMANSGSGANSMYAGNGGALGLERPGGRAVHLLGQRDRHHHRRNVHRHRGDHRRH